jgi:hypothetical protein
MIIKPSLFGELQRNVSACPPDTRRLVFDFNKQALLETLRCLHAEEATVTYAGSSDEGQIDEVRLTPETIDADAVQVQLVAMHQTWNAESSTSRASLALEPRNLRTALADFCDQAIDLAGHTGYEINDGGEGRLTISVGGGEVALQHTDFYTESDTCTYEL